MKWITTTYHVDLETGEEITKWIDEFYVVKILLKKIKYNEHEKFGIIEYTKGCRRRPKQGELYETARRNI